MPDYSELLKAIKKAATDAVTASNPVNVCFGTVLSTSPLQIKVDQKLTLTNAQLVLTTSVTEKKIRVIDTDYVVRDGLKSGETVVLLRMQGGQKFIVIDKAVNV